MSRTELGYRTQARAGPRSSTQPSASSPGKPPLPPLSGRKRFPRDRPRDSTSGADSRMPLSGESSSCYQRPRSKSDQVPSTALSMRLVHLSGTEPTSRAASPLSEFCGYVYDAVWTAAVAARSASYQSGYAACTWRCPELM
eukprot:1465418-Rhodomonas_salina.1